VSFNNHNTFSNHFFFHFFFARLQQCGQHTKDIDTYGGWSASARNHMSMKQGYEVFFFVFISKNLTILCCVAHIFDGKCLVSAVACFYLPFWHDPCCCCINRTFLHDRIFNSMLSVFANLALVFRS
jgi:hypothetical protein